jgi:hypothetical protein
LARRILWRIGKINGERIAVVRHGSNASRGDRVDTPEQADLKRGADGLGALVTGEHCAGNVYPRSVQI